MKIGSTDPEKEREKGRTSSLGLSESWSCSWHGSTVTMIIGKSRRSWGKETTPRLVYSRRVVKEQESAPLDAGIRDTHYHLGLVLSG